MADKMVKGFREKLQKKIAYHREETARLQKWEEALVAAGFDWENVTEAQAWAVYSLHCAGEGGTVRDMCNKTS